MSGKEWGNPNTHGNLGNSFGQFHTQIRPIQTVFIFQTELKKESGFLLKRFVCQPNAIPTASVISNSFLRITDARKSKNEPRWIIRKKWMNAWKKSRPCARMLKKIYMYTLAPRPRKCLCFMCKDSEQSQKKAQFRILSPAGNFVYGVSDDFFLSCDQKIQCKLRFKWKVMRLEHKEAI